MDETTAKSIGRIIKILRKVQSRQDEHDERIAALEEKRLSYKIGGTD